MDLFHYVGILTFPLVGLVTRVNVLTRVFYVVHRRLNVVQVTLVFLRRFGVFIRGYLVTVRYLFRVLARSISGLHIIHFNFVKNFYNFKHDHYHSITINQTTTQLVGICTRGVRTFVFG